MTASHNDRSPQEKLILQPIQWASLPHLEEVTPISELDYAILHEIREVLKRNNAVSRFGVNLLHRHFDLGSDEILVEYTDEIARVQTCRVERLEDFRQAGDRIETNWVFDRDGASVVCKGGCVYNQGHRRRHI